MRITLPSFVVALLTACGTAAPVPTVVTPAAHAETETEPPQVEEQAGPEVQVAAPAAADPDFESVSVGALDVRGALDPAQLTGPIRESVELIGACYDEALTRDPSLAGIVEVAVIINASGGINAVNARRGIDRDLDSCVVRTVRALSFPPVTGGGIAVASIPFHFRHR